MKSKNNKIKKVNRNGFPEPKKVICSKCEVNEFFVKFVISRLAYSQKNNLGYWKEDESCKDQEWCSSCLRKLFYEDKETYWKTVKSSKKRALFRVYLAHNDI